MDSTPREEDGLSGVHEGLHVAVSALEDALTFFRYGIVSAQSPSASTDGDRISQLHLLIGRIDAVTRQLQDRS